MRIFKAFSFIFFWTICIASTFANSFSEKWIYFYHDELYVSIFTSLFILVLLVIMKFQVELKITVIDCSIMIYCAYVILNSILLNKTCFPEDEIIAFGMIILTFFILKHYFLDFTDQKSLSYQIIISVYILISLPILNIIFELSGLIPNINNVFIFCGGLYNPGATANYLTTLAPFLIAIILFYNDKNILIKLFAFILLLASIVIIILIKARTAWIAFFVSFLYITWAGGYFKRVSSLNAYKNILIIITILILTVSFLGMYYLKKDSADGRVFIWGNCLQIIKEEPLFGHGYYTFYKTYNEQQLNYFEKNQNDIKNGILCSDANYAFNDYLQIATEMGVLGLGLFLLIPFYIFRTNETVCKGTNKILFIGAKACILSILICAIFSYPFQKIQNNLLFFFFAAYIASINKPFFYIKNISSKIMVIILALFVIFVIYYQVSKFIACTKWNKASALSENNQLTESSLIYDTVYPELNKDPLFLFNYGTSLLLFNECDKAVSVLKKSARFRTSYNLYLNMGYAYECNENDSLAELFYQRAAFLIPHRFLPRYNLFKLYRRSNKKDKALKIAKEIYLMPVKIYTKDVRSIKNEILEYININGKK